MRRRLSAACVLVLLAGVLPAAAADDPPGAGDSLLVSRELYAAAEYENALGMLDRLKGAPGDNLRLIEQYRAFCLLALNRSGDASSFAGVLRILEDPDLADRAGSAPLADLKTLTAGFRELAVAALAPPQPPAPPEAPAPVLSLDVAQPPATYTANDRKVIAPVIIRQGLPQVPAQMVAGAQGVIEVVINEEGRVERAVMRSSLGGQYDRLVLDAARQWKYQPATLDGQPVKFRKMVQISVKRAE